MIYDARNEDGHRVATLRRNTFAGGGLRFSSKHQPCKPAKGAVKVWTGPSGFRPVVVRRKGEVIAQIARM